MAAGATYEKIATTTLSTAAANVTFSAISGAYTDLVLVANLGCSAGGNRAFWRVNGNVANDYSKIYLLGDGSSTGTSDTQSESQSFIFDGIAVPTTLSGTLIQHYQNYSNTNMFKQVLSRCNHPTSGTMMVAGQWRQTAAITSIYLEATGSATWITGSTFTLYGILAA
jgi:hypothetical protein